MKFRKGHTEGKVNAMFQDSEMENRRKTTILECVALLLAIGLGFGGWATEASAQCDTPQNQVTNCDFDFDISSWDPGNNATIIHAPTDGNPTGSGPGSLEVRSGPGVNGVGDEAVAVQCISVAGDTGYEFFAYHRLLSGTITPGGTHGCLFFANKYSLDNCVDYQEWSGHPFTVPTDSWARTSTSGLIRTTPETRSVRLDLYCDSADATPFTVRFDDVVFLPVFPIFSDGFESGTTSQWSAVAQ